MSNIKKTLKPRENTNWKEGKTKEGKTTWNRLFNYKWVNMGFKKDNKIWVRYNDQFIKTEMEHIPEMVPNELNAKDSSGNILLVDKNIKSTLQKVMNLIYLENDKNLYI